MPIHPFAGKSLHFSRIERDQLGNNFILVEHFGDGHIKIPIAWTDLSPAVVAPQFEGRQLRATLREFLQLAEVCRSALDIDKLGLKTTVCPLNTSQGQANGRGSKKQSDKRADDSAGGEVCKLASQGTSPSSSEGANL